MSLREKVRKPCHPWVAPKTIHGSLQKGVTSGGAKAPESSLEATKLNEHRSCRQSIFSLDCLRFSHADGARNMSRRLPSLNALKAFEAAARHKNFTVAANELCVTQGAVSHQVKALEAELGLKLFIREHQQLVLTEAGRFYLETARDALDRLAAGTERLLQRHTSGALTVSTSPNFAAKWLVHRLGRFAETHAGIELRVSAALQHVDFVHDDVDLAIRHGDGHWPGLDVMPLCVEHLFPVCSPSLLRGRNALRRPENLRHHSLLHIDDTSAWTRWLEAAGLEN